MSYQLQLAPATKRQIRKSDPANKKRILDALEKFSIEPRPSAIACFKEFIVICISPMT